jgi:hypothetical protein
MVAECGRATETPQSKGPRDYKITGQLIQQKIQKSMQHMDKRTE